MAGLPRGDPEPEPDRTPLRPTESGVGVSARMSNHNDAVST